MNINLPDALLLYIIIGFITLIVVLYLALNISKKYSSNVIKKIRNSRFKILLTFLILLLVAVLSMKVVLIPILPGYVGVYWKRFGGTVLGAPFNEGSVIVAPWNKLILYNRRFQIKKVQALAVSSEGLKVTLNIDIRYAINVPKAPLLHKLVGEEYPKVMLVPEVESAARLIVSSYTAEQVYSTDRTIIQNKIFSRVTEDMLLKHEYEDRDFKLMPAPTLIRLEDILISDVILPKKIDEAIENKVKQYYLDQEFVIKLKVAKKEALRKHIEAEGIADFQSTVVGGISETYLKWRGIEATLELAKSNNAKVVVIGGGKNGLPLILNTESTPDMGHLELSHEEKYKKQENLNEADSRELEPLKK